MGSFVLLAPSKLKEKTATLRVSAPTSLVKNVWKVGYTQELMMEKFLLYPALKLLVVLISLR